QGVAATGDQTHKVPTAVWVRGRIAAMMAKATPEQRKPLDERIAEEWKAVQSKNDLEAVRQFASMFDVPFAVGREARLELAESIIARSDKPAFLEAEMALQQLRGPGLGVDPKIGGRALEALMRLEEERGSIAALELAASYRRQLGKEFAKQVFHGGKTGADLLKAMDGDRRYVSFLKNTGPRWMAGKISSRESEGQNHGDQRLFVFQPENATTS